MLHSGAGQTDSTSFVGNAIYGPLVVGTNSRVVHVGMTVVSWPLVAGTSEAFASLLLRLLATCGLGCLESGVPIICVVLVQILRVACNPYWHSCAA